MLASITRVHAKPYIYVDTITRRVSVVHRVKVSLLTTLASTCYQFLPNTVCLIGENYTRRKRIKVCSKVSKSRTIVYKGNLTPPFYTSFNFLVDTCNCVLKIARSIWIDCFTFTMFRSEANGCRSTEQANCTESWNPFDRQEFNVRSKRI